MSDFASDRGSKNSVAGKAIAKKILLVEDEPDLLEFISEALAERGFLVSTCSTVQSAFQNLDETSFDLVVADVGLGDSRQGGIEVLERIQSMKIPVILISGDIESAALKKAINLGAKFFLEKPFDLSSLFSVVDSILDASSETGSRLELIVIDHRLTARERDIFEFVSQGRSNREIAEATGTSERTVKAHLSSIFKKTGVSSRSELLALLLK